MCKKKMYKNCTSLPVFQSSQCLLVSLRCSLSSSSLCPSSSQQVLLFLAPTPLSTSATLAPSAAAIAPHNPTTVWLASLLASLESFWAPSLNLLVCNARVLSVASLAPIKRCVALATPSVEDFSSWAAVPSISTFN